VVAGIAGSNPPWDMDICLLCLYVMFFCVGRGLCDGLITRPEESCRVSVCVITETPKGALCPSWELQENEWMNDGEFLFSVIQRRCKSRIKHL
jgi:hypothetical protein